MTRPLRSRPQGAPEAASAVPEVMRVVTVLHVINRLSTSGAETSLRGLLLSGRDTGIRHVVTTLETDNNRFDDVREAGVSVLEPARRLTSWFARIRHVLDAIRTVDADLVHTTLFEADVAGRVAARIARRPCVTSLVNTPYAEAARQATQVAAWKLRTVQHIDGFLSRRATVAFHAITQAVADAAVRDLGIDPARITVVPRGRDRARLGTPTLERRITVRDRLGLEERHVVVHIGRHEPQKNIVTLLDAVAAARRQDRDILLVQAGREGNDSHRIYERAARPDLVGVVKFLGFRDDVGDLLCAADVFAFPSLYEGLGGVVLEAMAMRIPIVASDVPAVREVLDGGRCGRLVPASDAEALAGALVEMLRRPDVNRPTVEAAASRFEQVYGHDRYVAGMERLYAGIVAPPLQKGGRPC